MQTMIMDLYKENNANPMSGCLPLLIQMPILIALYRSLYTFQYITVEHAGFIWIATLSTKDPYYILPVVAAVTTFLQSKMTMSTNDPTQRTMLYMMPLLIGWISISLPAGMVLYWCVFNLVGMAQQYIINRQVKPLREGAAER
jgi:YidC/Oxa1 family membrane protein insertase